jgi:hypothetical protein
MGGERWEGGEEDWNEDTGHRRGDVENERMGEKEGLKLKNEQLKEM